MSIQADLLQPALPKYIELFVIDATVLGGPVWHVCPATNMGAAPISFGGQAYDPLPIAGTGWQSLIDGAPPQPTLKVSNVTRYLTPYLTAYADLVGATVTRYQTFDKYLDSGSNPDSTQVFNTGVYLIVQKVSANKDEVQFKLSSVIDAPSLKIPRKQLLRAEFPGIGLFQP